MKQDAEKRFIVRNGKDLEEFYFNLLEMTDKVYFQGFDVKNFECSPLTLKFDNGSEKDSGTITTSMMEVVIDLQNQIWNLARLHKGKNLTSKERSALELKVKVQSGCTEILIELAKILFPEVSKMSMEQLLVVTDTIKAIAFFGFGIGLGKVMISSVAGVVKSRIEASRSKAHDEHERDIAEHELEKARLKAELEKDRENHVAQERLARIESEIEARKAQNAAWNDALDHSLRLLDADLAGNRSLCKKLAKVPGDLKINNTPYSKEELEAYSEIPEQTEPEPEYQTYDGYFKIKRKDYSKAGDVVIAELQSIDGKHTIKAPLPPTLFSSDDLKLIEQKKALHLSVTGRCSDGKFVGDLSFFRKSDDDEASPEKS